jgi:hypothetical protein
MGVRAYAPACRKEKTRQVKNTGTDALGGNILLFFVKI